MMTRHDLDIIQLTHPGDAAPAVRHELTACWIAVTNAGGAAGFPFPPVNASHVAPAVDALAARLDPQRSRILLARISGAPAGWVALSRDPSPLIGGMGLEDFYARLGWRVTGRWPGKLRLAPDDTRDEILMILTPL